jgi:hypothetical protein
MRAFSWRQFSIGVTLTGFVLVGATGCQTGTSGMNWLSWGQKPSTTAISSAPRPAANALPGPSQTTGGQGGLASSGTSPYGQASHGSGQTTASGYQTGPYGTGRGTHRHPGGTSSVAGVPTSGYGAQSATPPYQSPYAAPGGSGADSSRYTADARSAVYPDSGTGTSSPTGSWNSGQWRRGADAVSTTPPAGSASYGSQSYSGTSPATSPYGSKSGSSYGANSSYGSPQSTYPQASNASTSGYQQPANYEQPGSSGPKTASRAWATDLDEPATATPASDYPSSSSYPSSAGSANSSTGLSGSTTPGTWRPGSTSRNASALGTPTGTTQPGNSYPSTGSSYPSTGGPYPASSSGSGYGGYPTTGR